MLLERLSGTMSDDSDDRAEDETGEPSPGEIDSSDEDGKGNYRPKKLFTVSNQDLVRKDAKFWELSLGALLEMYKRTSVATKQDVVNKAHLCAKIAGFGLALAEHFGHGVNSLDSIDAPAMELSGTDSYRRYTGHTERLELVAQRVLN